MVAVLAEHVQVALRLDRPAGLAGGRAELGDADPGGALVPPAGRADQVGALGRGPQPAAVRGLRLRALPADLAGVGVEQGVLLALVAVQREDAIGDGGDVGGGELCGAGDAEDDDARAVVGEHHVGRLQVAVDDSGAVHVAQCLGEPGGEFAQAGQRERAVFADVGAEVRARYVERGRPGSRRVGVRVHDRGREGPADLAGGDHLAAMGVPPARAKRRAWGGRGTRRLRRTGRARP